MSTLDEEERREYYRIEDRMALEITPLSGAEASSEELLQDASPLFNLLTELHLSEFESQHLLRQISERDRSVAAYLKVLNKRLDILGQILTQTLHQEINEPQTVMLSEGGMSFEYPQAWEVGTHVAIKMYLLPQTLGLLLRGYILHCQAQENGQFAVGVEFEALNDAQRQLLARHILQKQAAERRLAREQADLEDLS